MNYCMRAYTKLVFIVSAHYIPFLQGSHSRHLRYGLQYLLSFGKKGQTTDLSLHSDCLGNGDDPLAKTFDQVPQIFHAVFDEFLMVVLV